MFALVILLLTLVGTQCQEEIEVISVSDPNNITIAFGSCLNTFDEDQDIQQVLQSIIQTQSDLWMWTGDAVYLDGESFFYGALPGPGYDLADASFIEGVFEDLKNNENYIELLDNMPVIGTWDDHDYGYDSANKTFEYKQRNMGIYLDFLDVPENSSRRNQEGLYTSYYIGDDKAIKIILLDTRYNRDDESNQDLLVETDSTSTFDDMLGAQQWEWLNNQLQDETPNYTLIVSATQILPNDRPIAPDWFDNSRQRLYDMVVENQKSGVVLISGDVHYAEMLKHPCPGRVGYNNFYEFTSSGLTHSLQAADIVDGIFPDTYSREEDRYFGRNFGLLRFTKEEGSSDPLRLVFEARDADGNVVLTREVPHSDLVFDKTAANNYSGCEAIEDNWVNEVGEAVDNAENFIEEEADNIGDEISEEADNIGDEISNAANDIFDGDR